MPLARLKVELATAFDATWLPAQKELTIPAGAPRNRRNRPIPRQPTDLALSVSRKQMRRLRLVSTAVAALLATLAAASGGTLGDPQIGFSAQRVLVFDGRTYIGRIWSMPGAQRHEQVFPAMAAAFILRSGSATADILLPALHTVVEFPLPQALALLGRPGLLGEPVDKEPVDGVATTKYAVDRTISEGHLKGALWLSREGIPMRCDGTFTARNGKISTVHWQLRHVEIGRQDRTLFQIPPGYATISPQAASTLLGLRLSPHASH